MDYTTSLGYYNDGKKNVLEDINDIKKNYLKLGYHLKEIKDNGWYRFKYPADCFDKYCKEQYNISKSTVSRLIKIVEKFCEEDTYCLLEDYVNYSKSQLEEMVSMSDDDIQYIRPDMTIKQIRQCKSYDNAAEEEEKQVPGQMELENDFKEYCPDIATSQQEDISDFDKSMIRNQVFKKEKTFNERKNIYGEGQNENDPFIKKIKYRRDCSLDLLKDLLFYVDALPDNESKTKKCKIGNMSIEITIN